MWQTLVVYYVVVFFCMCVAIPAKCTPDAQDKDALAVIQRMMQRTTQRMTPNNDVSYTLSNTAAKPCPTPIHSDATP
jgi:hypothetical protein